VAQTCYVRFAHPAEPGSDAFGVYQIKASFGMVKGMATKKVTVTLKIEQVEQIRALVETGQAASISGFVQHAVGVSLDDVAGWGAMLAQDLDKTGGPLSAEEKAWADEVLGSGKRQGRPAA